MIVMNNMNLLFVDLNADLVEKVSTLGIESICTDYFQTANKIHRPVLMTASNPHFSMGGGLDALFAKHYPLIVQHKQAKGGDMERIQNIVFAITVNSYLSASPDIIEKAIRFAVENTHDGETLLLSGVGTGIGQLTELDFINVLKRII
jgi:hypothetical protein